MTFYYSHHTVNLNIFLKMFTFPNLTDFTHLWPRSVAYLQVISMRSACRQYEDILHALRYSYDSTGVLQNNLRLPWWRHLAGKGKNKIVKAGLTINGRKKSANKFCAFVWTRLSYLPGLSGKYGDLYQKRIANSLSATHCLYVTLDALMQYICLYLCCAWVFYMCLCHFMYTQAHAHMHIIWLSLK